MAALKVHPRPAVMVGWCEMNQLVRLVPHPEERDPGPLKWSGRHSMVLWARQVDQVVENDSTTESMAFHAELSRREALVAVCLAKYGGDEIPLAKRERQRIVARC